MQQQKLKSLTHPTTPLKRKLPVRGLLIAALLPLFGMVTAYGIAPDTDTRDVPVQALIENLALPQAPLPNEQAAQVFHFEEKVLSGETLGALLARLGVAQQDIALLLSQPAAQIGRSLRSGQRVLADISEKGELQQLKLNSSDGTHNRISRQADTFILDQPQALLESRTVMRSGRIESSLFAATEAASLPDSVAVKMADIFGTQLDFRSDLRKGDTFSIVYEMQYRNGEPTGEGKILSAEYVNAGKPYRAVLYRTPTGREEYYTPAGEALSKGFLRSPLEFSRITSSFSNSRLHPVHGFHRAHTGTDFGAPTGARVKAVGDGVVSFAGRKGGYGNLIILRHGTGFETYYAHLNGFANGLRPGGAVSQGQIIGFVGMTGTATGPHLHYEVRIGGLPRNPVTVKLPGSPPLPLAQRARFNEQTSVWAQRLDQLRGTNLAALD
jgi:murein DD-endopeptidase MepM/ murein hydrolase activator NlpD